MPRMHRAAGILALVALLAACAAPGAGGSANDTGSQAVPSAAASGEASAGPTGSASADMGSADDNRVDIGTLAEDPSAVQGQQIKVLARVDQVLVDGVAFVTSPSASDENQILVVIRPDAQVDKDIAEGRVVWVEGTVVGFTEDELRSAGVDVSLDQLGDFGGEFAIVADAIRDPLTSDSAS